MRQQQLEIAQNSKSGHYMLMKLRAPALAKSSEPGQFVMLQVPRNPDPLLRRPFSIHDLWREKEGTGKPAGILVLYDIVGRGTALMSRLNAGDKVSVVGPLGYGFSQCETKRALLVAGGIGVAPLRFLSNRLHNAGCSVSLLIGARTSDLLYTEGFTSLSRVTFATDDGSKGIKGPITLALEASLDESCENVTVYATGPKPMLARVANLTALYDIRCELSLEAFMACGIGACNGCVVKATGKDGEPSYLRVCKDGPVFNSKRIVSF